MMFLLKGKTMISYGFIGAGKMASAIIKGMISKGIAPLQISCTCGNDDTGKILSSLTGIRLLDEKDFFETSNDVVVLACKPQQLTSFGENAKKVNASLLVSILAGTTIQRIREKFSNVGEIARVMPNMPAQIGKGISAFSLEKGADKNSFTLAKTVLEPMGEYIEVAESKLDAVTALSGSGPGYLFEYASCMIDSAIELGFDFETAKKLAYQTILGSAILMCESELSAKELRDSVCSPNGTTLAGLEALKKNNFQDAIKECLFAAEKRSKELSKL